VPESELAGHMLMHRSKDRKFLPAPLAKPDMRVREEPKGIPFEEFSRQMLASYPQKSNLSLNEIKETFVQVLQEMGLSVNSLKVDLKRASILSAVVFDEKRNVELYYDDNYFRTLTKDQITAELSHEACHIATLPHSGVLFAGGASDFVQSFQIAFIELFDEFLAHKEFARRFRGTKMFDLYQELKGRDFENYGIILKMARSGQMDPVKALFTILNDAIYFPIVEDARFLKWCKDNELQKTSEFLDWLIEDFRFIEGLNLNRMDTMEMLHQAGGLSLGAHPAALLNLDKIIFADSAPMAEDMISKKNRHLAESWRKRRLSHSSA